MFSSTIKIQAEKDLLKAYYEALNPEKDFKTERGSYTLRLGKSELTIEITAKDATAFRAIMTSLTGLMAIVDKGWKIIGEQNGR